MTLLVRDEEDILEANIKYHHSVGVDFFIITDNNSTDKTPSIIQKYVDMGIAKVIHENRNTFDQGAWVTSMARMAYHEFNAGWVINNDADEFWWTENMNLKEVLKKIPGNVGALEVDRLNFIPLKNSKGTFYETMDIKEVASKNMFDKKLPAKVMHRGYPDVEVGNGNHTAKAAGLKLKILSKDIEILHFPMRTYEQFALKIANGGSSMANNDLLPKNIGRRWRQLFELYKEGKLIDHYNESLFSEDEIEKKIRENILIKDERLKKYLQKNM